jgi:hypothetical protein
LSDTDGLLDGIGYDPAPGRLEEAERQAGQERLAATLIRRTAMRHDRQCRSECRHRNHERDVRHLGILLETLGLDDEPARLDDYDQPLVWHAATRSELALIAS